MNIKAINKKLKEHGYPFELSKGSGYFYFVFDDGVRFETYSVYTNSVSNLPLESWLYEANEFSVLLSSFHT